MTSGYVVIVRYMSISRATSDMPGKESYLVWALLTNLMHGTGTTKDENRGKVNSLN